MRKVIKKNGKTVNAYRLGEKNSVIDSLLAEGKLIYRDDGCFEVLSQETANGDSGAAGALWGTYFELCKQVCAEKRHLVRLTR